MRELDTYMRWDEMPWEKQKMLFVKHMSVLESIEVQLDFSVNNIVA